LTILKFEQDSLHLQPFQHPFQEMGIRVYISANSGNQKLENEQQKIVMVLTMRKKEFEVIDIMKPGNQNHRTYMRDRGKKKEGQRNVLPPQIFNGDDYIGDFEDFDLANEDDVLEEFLGIERENPKVEPYKTGAVAPDVAKRVVGKLPKERIPVVKKEEVRGPKKPTTKGGTSSSSSSNCTGTASTSATSSCYGETDSGVDFEDMSDKISDDGDSAEDNGESEEEEGDKDDGTDKKKKEFNDCDSTGNDREDGRGMIKDDEDDFDSDNGDVETDSDDFTDSEDDTVEFMPDGEQVRKCKRGFKVLQNCKRFWKVDNNV